MSGDVLEFVAYRFLPDQAAPVLIHQEEVEELVIDHLSQALGNAFEQGVQIEDRNKFDAQFIDQTM